jgi:hypothetical protein
MFRSNLTILRCIGNIHAADAKHATEDTQIFRCFNSWGLSRSVYDGLFGLGGYKDKIM